MSVRLRLRTSARSTDVTLRATTAALPGVDEVKPSAMVSAIIHATRRRDLQP